MALRIGVRLALVDLFFTGCFSSGTVLQSSLMIVAVTWLSFKWLPTHNHEILSI